MTPSSEVVHLIEPQWIVPIVPDGVVLERHAVAVAGGRIVELLPVEEARRRYPQANAELVEVDYEPLSPILTYDAALAGDDLIHPNRANNILMEMAVPLSDDGREALDGATHKVSESFVQHRYSAVPMECRGRDRAVGAVRPAARRVARQPEPARGAPGVLARDRRPREQRPRADRRRRRRLRPEVVRRPRRDQRRDGRAHAQRDGQVDRGPT